MIALGEWVVAQSFEPKSVRWGNNVANMEHLILVGQQDDASGCSVILTTTVPRLHETSEGPKTGLSGHTVDNDFECEAIRRALHEYTIDAREKIVER